jgi:hypothetical protein
MTSGSIYCFSTVGDARVHKVGMTTQATVAQRMRGYIGLSKPRVMLAHRTVGDAVRAEATLLRAMKLCRFFTQRLDLGPEWWEAADDDVVERERAVLFLTDLVARAHPVEGDGRERGKERAKEGAKEGARLFEFERDEAADDDECKASSSVGATRKRTHDEEGLTVDPGAVARQGDLTEYWNVFDDYVGHRATAADLASVDALVDAYEASASCPVFCEFLPVPRATRRSLARDRYARFWGAEL